MEYDTDELYERDMREQEQDGWDDTEEDEDEDYGDVDPGFSSWQDYINYKYN